MLQHERLLSNVNSDDGTFYGGGFNNYNTIGTTTTMSMSAAVLDTSRGADVGRSQLLSYLTL